MGTPDHSIYALGDALKSLSLTCHLRLSPSVLTCAKQSRDVDRMSAVASRVYRMMKRQVTPQRRFAHASAGCIASASSFAVRK